MTTKPTMTRPWKSIAEFYDRIASKSPACAPMLRLVRQIECSDYACGLFAWTSHWDLYIVQTPVEHTYFGPSLKVALTRDGRIQFRYRDTYSEPEDRQWNRIVDAVDAFATLERFLDQRRWFVKYTPAAKTEREQTR